MLPLSLLLLLSLALPAARAVACLPYDLENECATVVGPVVFSPLPQAAVFSAISLSISDARMVPADCRRPLVWYLCNLVFPTCDGNSSRVCYPSEQACESMVSRCSPYVNVSSYFSCSWRPIQQQGVSRAVAQFLPLSHPVVQQDGRAADPAADDCSLNFTTTYIENTPIPVTTCLSGSPNVTVECCPTPYIRSPEGECVVKCMQYLFGESRENAWSIAAVVLTWVGTLMFVIAFVPTAFLTQWYSFPSVLTHSMELCVLLLLHVIVWSSYEGSQEYICGSQPNMDYMEKMLAYLDSSKCIFQLWFVCFMILGVLFFSCALSLTFTAQLYRFQFPFLENYTAEKMVGGRLVIILVVCWLVPFLLSLGLLINAIVAPANDKFVTPIPGTYFCFPRIYIQSSLYLFYIPTLIFLAFSIINLAFSMCLMMYRNRQIFYFHWRTLVFVTHESIFFTIMQILIFYFGYYHWDAGLVTLYPECVAAHPRDPDPSCDPVYLDAFWYFSLFASLLFAWLILFSLYMYWSNTLMWRWWYMLITTREIPAREIVFTASTQSRSKA